MCIRDRDTLPKKLFAKPLSGGRTDGLALDPAELEWAITHYFEPVSYTHLDVYKRQLLRNWLRIHTDVTDLNMDKFVKIRFVRFNP